MKGPDETARPGQGRLKRRVMRDRVDPFALTLAPAAFVITLEVTGGGADRPDR